MFVFTRLSSTADLNVLYTAHYGLVYPFLTYGVAGGGHGCKKYEREVFILLQKSSRMYSWPQTKWHLSPVKKVLLGYVSKLYIYEVILYIKKKDAAFINRQVHNNLTRYKSDYKYLPYNLESTTEGQSLQVVNYSTNLLLTSNRLSHDQLFKNKTKRASPKKVLLLFRRI
jgi:hypothetical protein